MIAFTAQSPMAAPQYTSVDGANPPAPSEIVAEVEPTPQSLQSYLFPQQLIPLDGGKTLLRLRNPLTLSVNQMTLEFDVEGWGIRMRCDDVADLPRQVARRFLRFFSKADARLLSESERPEWVRILDQVDHTQFSVERSAPHYVEGTLLKKHPLMVEWHDGKTERLPVSLAVAFYPLDPGDQFSAFVKLGKDNEALAVERVALISA